MSAARQRSRVFADRQRSHETASALQHERGTRRPSRRRAPRAPQRRAHARPLVDARAARDQRGAGDGSGASDVKSRRRSARARCARRARETGRAARARVGGDASQASRGGRGGDTRPVPAPSGRSTPTSISSSARTPARAPPAAREAERVGGAAALEARVRGRGAHRKRPTSPAPRGGVRAHCESERARRTEPRDEVSPSVRARAKPLARLAAPRAHLVVHTDGERVSAISEVCLASHGNAPARTASLRPRRRRASVPRRCHRRRPRRRGWPTAHAAGRQPSARVAPRRPGEVYREARTTAGEPVVAASSRGGRERAGPTLSRRHPGVRCRREAPPASATRSWAPADVDAIIRTNFRLRFGRPRRGPRRPAPVGLGHRRRPPLPGDGRPLARARTRRRPPPTPWRRPPAGAGDAAGPSASPHGRGRSGRLKVDDAGRARCRISSCRLPHDSRRSSRAAVSERRRRGLERAAESSARRSTPPAARRLGSSRRLRKRSAR